MTQIGMICVATARVTGAGPCWWEGCLPRLREIGKATRRNAGGEARPVACGGPPPNWTARRPVSAGTGGPGWPPRTWERTSSPIPSARTAARPAG